MPNKARMILRVSFQNLCLEDVAILTACRVDFHSRWEREVVFSVVSHSSFELHPPWKCISRNFHHVQLNRFSAFQLYQFYQDEIRPCATRLRWHRSAASTARAQCTELVGLMCSIAPSGSTRCFEAKSNLPFLASLSGQGQQSMVSYVELLHCCIQPSEAQAYALPLASHILTGKAFGPKLTSCKMRRLRFYDRHEMARA